MAKKTVREVTCDTCGVREFLPATEKKVLPKGWTHVIAQDYKGTSFLDRDLCPEHSEPLLTLSRQIKWEERVRESEHS